MFFTQYSLFCFLGYIFLFLVFVCLFVLWFTSLSFPHIFFLIFFVLYFKVIFFLFLVCVLWFTFFSFPFILFTQYFWFFEIYIFSNFLLFGHLALPTTCLTHALLLQVLEHCIFSQDRHIVVTAKPLQTSTANTPGILEATTRPCHSGQCSPCFFISIIPIHCRAITSLCQLKHHMKLGFEDPQRAVCSHSCFQGLVLQQKILHSPLETWGMETGSVQTQIMALVQINHSPFHSIVKSFGFIAVLLHKLFCKSNQRPGFCTFDLQLRWHWRWCSNHSCSKVVDAIFDVMHHVILLDQ